MRIILFVLGLLWSSSAFGQNGDSLSVKIFIENVEDYEIKTYLIRNDRYAWIDTFYNKQITDSTDVTYIFEIIEFLREEGTCHYQRFYPNGQIMMDYHYAYGNWFRNNCWSYLSFNDYFEGTFKHWYSNGNLFWERDYVKFVCSSSICEREAVYYENGQQKSISFPDSDGVTTWKTWYKNGSPKETIAYFNGEKHGQYIKWNNRYILNQRLNYKNSQLHGKQFYYDNEGQLIKTEVYENGKLIKN